MCKSFIFDVYLWWEVRVQLHSSSHVSPGFILHQVLKRLVRPISGGWVGVESSAAKPRNLNLISGAHRVKEENQLMQVVSMHVLWYMHVHVCIDTWAHK